MSAELPKYRKIAEELKKEILSGDLHYMETLPTEQSVSDKYHVSRITTRKAFAFLESHGLVSAVSAKKRHVIWQQRKFNNRYHVVACFGTAPLALQEHEHFLTESYDRLYNALAYELQFYNVSFPKIILTENQTQLPELARIMHYDIAYFLTSCADFSLYNAINVPIVQNMERYDTRPTIVIRYNTESLVLKIVSRLLEMKKKNIFIAYKNIAFPFQDNIFNKFKNSLTRHKYNGDLTVFSGSDIPDNIITADTILLNGPCAGDFFALLNRHNIKIPEETTVISISNTFTSYTPPHCKQFINNDKEIAKITAKIIAAILEGDPIGYDVNIINWYTEHGEY